MNIYFVTARSFAVVALAILLYGFIVPSVGFHGTLERIQDDKVENIPSYVYPLWNYYQKGRYFGVNSPEESKYNLKKMIEFSEEIGVPSMPVWNFSLEAPNYPKEAFPQGLPVFIHFDGLSGEVHEMNTINHYVGMPPMESGGPYERALAPYALIILALLFVFFILYNNKWIDRLMFIPMVLPFIFVGFYAYWLYWFGHNLHRGAITIDPFMPVLLGDGKVAQFTTHAYPTVGFWALVAISIFSFFAWWLKKRGLKEHLVNRVTPLHHFLMLVFLLIGVAGIAYLVKTDIGVNKLEKLDKLVYSPRVETPIKTEMSEPSEIEKEEMQEERDEQRKEQELQIKALEERAGSLGKFKVTKMYKSNCAPCHGASGEGNFGSKLIGLSEEYILKKLLEYKTNEEAIHVETIKNLSEEDIKQLTEEISQFKDQ
jgi:cytochrome c553